MSFAAAEQIADAVLFEGYVLYPYRASAAKNRLRWQFGVLVPEAHGEDRGGAEPASMQTECLVEATGEAAFDLRLRFLHVQSRAVEEAIDEDGAVFRPVASIRVDDRELVTWDEGVAATCDVPGMEVRDLLAAERRETLEVPGGREVEPVHDAAGATRARFVRERQPLRVALAASAERVGQWTRLRVRVENITRSRVAHGASRDLLLRESLVGAHLVVAVHGGRFVSLVDPPAAAAAAAAACVNRHTWPALLGSEERRDLILSSPIILPDYPTIAPESPGDLHDGTEIDEILTLRIITLTDDEKREARATDERARRIIDRSDELSPAVLDRLHGTVRTIQPGDELDDRVGSAAAWAFFDPPGAAPPELASVVVGGTAVARGTRVRLQPRRRADAMDMFLKERDATVAGVYRDVEDRAYVAVTLDDDPGADLQGSTGRYFYFYPDELEVADGARAGGAGASNEEES